MNKFYLGKRLNSQFVKENAYISLLFLKQNYFTFELGTLSFLTQLLKYIQESSNAMLTYA